MVPQIPEHVPEDAQKPGWRSQDARARELVPGMVFEPNSVDFTHLQGAHLIWQTVHTASVSFSHRSQEKEFTKTFFRNHKSFCTRTKKL